MLCVKASPEFDISLLDQVMYGLGHDEVINPLALPVLRVLLETLKDSPTPIVS